MVNRKNRRDFLKGCCALGAAGMASQLTQLGMMTANAQGPGYKALVCVFLFGGNDGNNTVVPIDGRYAAYQTMRTAVAIPQANVLPAGGTGLGFHPALTNVQRLFNQNRGGVALNVGTLVRPTFKMADGRLNTNQIPRNLYSHSDQTQQWQSSDPSGGATGWGGRINDITAAMNTGTLPSGLTVNGGNALFLSGPVTQPLNVSNLTSFGLTRFGDGTAMNIRQNALPQVIQMDSGLQLVSAANGVLGGAIRSAQELNAALQSAPALPVAFPNTGLGQQLAQVYRIMSVRGTLGMNRQIFFAGMGGFDNHEDLVARQQPLLATLDAALGAFFNALDATASPPDVTLFTESEFNRTADSNATVGSDHAWGGPQLMFNNSAILASPATGSRIFGTMPQHLLRGPDDAGDRGYWIPTIALDQYAATFGSWFGVTPAQLSGIFPNLANFPTQTLGFL
jgi:uncharacterized protein (DUF1501 family)